MNSCPLSKLIPQDWNLLNRAHGERLIAITKNLELFWSPAAVECFLLEQDCKSCSMNRLFGWKRDNPCRVYVVVDRLVESGSYPMYDVTGTIYYLAIKSLYAGRTIVSYVYQSFDSDREAIFTASQNPSVLKVFKINRPQRIYSEVIWQRADGEICYK